MTRGRFFAALRMKCWGTHDDSGELGIEGVRSYVDGLGYVAEIPDRSRGWQVGGGRG